MPAVTWWSPHAAAVVSELVFFLAQFPVSLLAHSPGASLGEEWYERGAAYRDTSDGKAGRNSERDLL